MDEVAKIEVEFRISGKKPDKVYVVGCGDTENYKIGIAASISQRIDSLQSGCPWPLVFILSVQVTNARQTEATLHKRYESQRIRGEWYHLQNKDILDIQAYLKKEIAHGVEGNKS